MYDSTMVPTALHIILTSNSMWHLSTVRTGVDMTLAKAPRGGRKTHYHRTSGNMILARDWWVGLCHRSGA